MGHVGNAGRNTARPDPARQPDPARERRLPGCGLEWSGLDPRGRIRQIRFNGRSLAPVRLVAAQARAFYAAYRRFAAGAKFGKVVIVMP